MIMAEKVLLTLNANASSKLFFIGVSFFLTTLALFVNVLAIVDFMKKIFTPSVTIEDVERIVNAAISRHLSSNVEVR